MMDALREAFRRERRELGIRLAVVRLREEADEVLRSLAPAERSRYATLRFPKRRREWLGGRLAAKRAVAALLGIEPDAVAILGRSQGEPVVVAGAASAPDVRVSISHSGHWAAAAAYRPSRAGAVGLDLEERAPVDPALYALAFTESEVSQIESTEPEAARRDLVLRLWTAKEAVLKAVGVGLRACLQQATVFPEAGRVRLRVEPGADRWFRVRTVAAAGCVISLAVGEAL
jgi:4'-phosphopantetheinyl transferase